jgi:hypothetical protein
VLLLVEAPMSSIVSLLKPYWPMYRYVCIV